MFDGIKAVEAALREVDRLQADVDYTLANLPNWHGWQDRVLRVENHLRAVNALYVKLAELESNGTLMRSEVFAALAEQQAQVAGSTFAPPKLAQVVGTSLATRQASQHSEDQGAVQQAS